MKKMDKGKPDRDAYRLKALPYFPQLAPNCQEALKHK